jgi:hypothetical protein
MKVLGVWIDSKDSHPAHRTWLILPRLVEPV